MPDRDPRLRAPDGHSLNLIGARVKQRRKALRIKQTDLIARLAVATGGRWTPSRIDITRIETCLRSCIDSELVAIAAVLDVDPAWLLVGDQPGKEGVREVVRQWQEPEAQSLFSVTAATDSERVAIRDEDQHQQRQ